MRIWGGCISLLMISQLTAEMITVPAGSYKPFLNEKAGEKSQPIFVRSYKLDQYPVLRREYTQFVNKNPKWQKKNVKRLFADEGYLTGEAVDNAPQTSVSWFSAKAYCAAKGKRLPTTQEWEYAASFPPPGKSKKYITDEIMKWYSEKKPDKLPEVGRYKNSLGIYDMHGMIWEWVYDFNTASVTGDSRADSDLERELFCGAAAIKSSDFTNYAAYMRYGFRSGLKGNYTTKYLGFRCAKDLDN